ncbi:MAG TPA: PEP-CTERM sorting domain-containing protein [Pyrinomonadaceae bacterium]
MRHRTLRFAAAMLCIIQVSGLPVYAGPVVMNQVLQVLTPGQTDGSLRLKNVYSQALPDGVTETSVSTASRTQSQTVKIADIDGLFSGSLAFSQQQKSDLNIVDQEEVQGTICDCGEILIAGGFPKWPLLFLAAIPLFFISGSEDTPPTTPVPTPTPLPPSSPTPPPTAPVPEPSTLLLFGTGLTAGAAFLRRRRAKNALNNLAKSEESSC